jgi:hypothetical protein
VQDAAAAVAAAAAAEPASAATLSSAPAVAAAPRRPALPQLTSQDKQELAQGLRVQRQTRQGGAGSGFVVVDVKAEPATVIEILKSYRAYTVSIKLFLHIACSSAVCYCSEYSAVLVSRCSVVASHFCRPCTSLR